MVKSQKIDRKGQQGKQPVIIDERPLPDLSKANSPVRTVNLVEVGDMSSEKLQLLLSELNRSHSVVRGGIHYFLPVRHGKIGSDVLFEKEFEDAAAELFEVVDQDGVVIKDAKIRLKGGAKEVQVIRQRV